MKLAQELDKMGQVAKRAKLEDGDDEENDCRPKEDMSSKIVLEGALDGITINEFIYFLTKASNNSIMILC